MASYPAVAFSKSSQVTPRSVIDLDVAEDGSVRGRKIHTKETYDVVLTHNYVDEATANTIEEFYEANPTQQVDVTWRSVTYNCWWASKPVVAHEEGGVWNVTSVLVGVRSDGL